jgi:hypothetical protein
MRPSFGWNLAPKTKGAARPSSKGAGDPKKGAGNAGCPLHPQPVCKGSEHTVITTVAPGSPGIPAHSGFNGFLRALPGDRLSCHRRRCDAKHHHQLDASVEASGPHDFVVRKINALVSSTARVHRIPPRVRDDRDTPLRVGRDHNDRPVIWVGSKSNYFCGGDWTGVK